MLTAKRIMGSVAMVGVYSALVVGTVGAEDRKEEAQALINMKAQTQGVVSLKDAMALVLNEQAGTITSAEFEEEDDQGAVYEIELAALDGNFYEYEINPVNGAILEVEEDFGEKLESFFDFDNSKEVKSFDQALFFAAVDQIEGEILSIEQEDDEGNGFYEVKTFSKGQMTKQLLNMTSGEVVFYRHMRDHDHD